MYIELIKNQNRGDITMTEIILKMCVVSLPSFFNQIFSKIQLNLMSLDDILITLIQSRRDYNPKYLDRNERSFH